MKQAKNTCKKLHNRLIAIDIENYNGGPVTSKAQAKWCYRTICNWIKPEDNDLIVVAADASTMTNLHEEWRSHRMLAGYGENGADLRLLESLDESIADRFNEVILVSGDGIFAQKISQLAVQGIRTTVYCHKYGLAKRLAFAATTVITTPTSPTTPPSAPRKAV